VDVELVVSSLSVSFVLGKTRLFGHLMALVIVNLRYCSSASFYRGTDMYLKLESFDNHLKDFLKRDTSLPIAKIAMVPVRISVTTLMDLGGVS
jgi:hypothetical protein